MKTRIAYVIDTIESPTAGTEQQVLRLIKSLDRNSYDPWLCCLRSSRWLAQELQEANCHVVGIKSLRTLRGWWGILRLARWFRDNGVQVVQTHFRDGSIVGLLAAWMAKVPVVVATRRGRPLYRGVLGRWLFRLLNTIPKRFIANSRFSRDLAVQQEGISQDKICVVYNSLDNDSFMPVTAEARAKARRMLGLDDSLPVVGIVANLNVWKRHDILLRAVADLGTRGCPVRVVCVGEGELLSALEVLATQLNIHDHVHFLGKRLDVPRVLPAFDVGVLCSDFESSSNSLIEYLAAGLPVVSTDVGGCAEAVLNGVCGYLTPPGDFVAMADAIEKLLSEGLDQTGLAQFRANMRVKHAADSVARDHLCAYGLLRDTA